MSTVRDYPTATLLRDGTVLVAAGHDGTNCLSSSEIFDPVTGEWTPTNPLNNARFFHTATLLPNGQVLAAGGHSGRFANGILSGGSFLSSAELYDPATNTVAGTGGLLRGREDFAAGALPSGRALIRGGEQITESPIAEVYDPVTGAFSEVPGVTTNRFNHAVTRLADGSLLITGGGPLITVDTVLDSAELVREVAGDAQSTRLVYLPAVGREP